ncbi:hypothetical protein B0H13DRAFT_2348713 [Mycena leptocephala]|nr:hypothetical protein B0H13DRAFT_2348713 [Mycena leptocephala]
MSSQSFAIPQLVPAPHWDLQNPFPPCLWTAAAPSMEKARARMEMGYASIFILMVKAGMDVDRDERGERDEDGGGDRDGGVDAGEAPLSMETEMVRTSEIEPKPGCGCAYVLSTPALSSSSSLPRSRLWLPRLPLYSPLFSSSSTGFALPRYVHASARDVEARRRWGSTAYTGGGGQGHVVFGALFGMSWGTRT